MQTVPDTEIERPRPVLPCRQRNHEIDPGLSEAQIKNATPQKNINYIVAPVEKTNIAPASIDLISIAQALHWFDFDHFYPEVRRVIKNDGVIAAWTYKLARVTPEIDKIIDKFHHEIIAEYWPPERTYVDNLYQNIPFPFQRISTPDFQINANWSLERFLNYLKTWSAVVYYEEKNSVNPLSLIEDDLLERWGSFNKSRNIHWPLTMLVSKIDTYT